MDQIVWHPNLHIYLKLVLFGQFLSLLIIHVWHPHNDIQMCVELSPLSNFDKIQNVRYRDLVFY